MQLINARVRPTAFSRKRKRMKYVANYATIVSVQRSPLPCYRIKTLQQKRLPVSVKKTGGLGENRGATPPPRHSLEPLPPEWFIGMVNMLLTFAVFLCLS